MGGLELGDSYDHMGLCNWCRGRLVVWPSLLLAPSEHGGVQAAACCCCSAGGRLWVLVLRVRSLPSVVSGARPPTNTFLLRGLPPSP